MQFFEMLINWALFLLQLSLLFLIIFLIYKAYRYLLALLKRRKAINSIKAVCKKCGYDLILNNTYSSLFKILNEPDAIVKTPSGDFYLRFIATVKKNENIYFVKKNIFGRSKSFGALYLNHKNIFSIAVARLFKPKNIPGDMFSWTYVDIAELPRGYFGFKQLDLPENANEVYLFNPVPLNIFYREGSVDRRLVGGEIFDGIAFHDYSSFLLMLEQLKEGAS